MQDIDSTRILDQEVSANRDPEYDVDPLFVNRWSPRSMAGNALDKSEFLPLFEAARWAPSSRNSQPWRFAYAARDDDEWGTFVDLLNEYNQQWAVNAAVLVVIFSETTDEKGRSLSTHSFDTGAAWENLALEGTRRNLVIHPIGGFDHAAAATALNAPDNYAVEAMVAIGERAPPEELPDDLQNREKPSGRKPLDKIITHGSF